METEANSPSKTIPGFCCKTFLSKMCKIGYIPNIAHFSVVIGGVEYIPVYFAFLEFESTDCVERALADKQIMSFGNNRLYVEAKEAKK